MGEMERLRDKVREILENEGLEEELVDKLADKIYNSLIISHSFNGARIEGNVIINPITPEEQKAEVFARDIVNYLRKTKRKMQNFTLVGVFSFIFAVILIMLGLTVQQNVLKWLPFVSFFAGLFFLYMRDKLVECRYSVYRDYFNRIYELAPHRKDLLAELQKAL